LETQGDADEFYALRGIAWKYFVADATILDAIPGNSRTFKDFLRSRPVPKKRSSWY